MNVNSFSYMRNGRKLSDTKRFQLKNRINAAHKLFAPKRGGNMRETNVSNAHPSVISIQWAKG